MFNITERIRRRMLRWLLVGVDPELVRRALKTINGGTTKHGTVSIDASNITLPGLVDGVDVSGIPHDAAGVPYALDKRGDTMSGLLKVEMGGTNVRLYGYESLGYVGSVGDLILFASDIPQMNLSNGWIYSKNFLPYADATYGLGYSGYRWSSLYLSGNAIIDGLVDGVDVGSHDHSGGTMGPAPLALTAIPDTVKVKSPYAGDESEVTETNTTYVSKKTLTVVRDSTNLSVPSTLLVEVEGKVTAGNTLTVGIFVDGTERITKTWTETAYTLKSGTYDVSAWGDGTHSIELKMKVDAGTGYQKLFEVWLK